MSGHYRQWVIYCVTFAVVFPLVYFLMRNDGPDLQRFNGTWTDPSGPAGNWVKFDLVPSQGSTGPLRAMDGRVRYKNFNGWGDGRCGWGYESFEPLRLNLVQGAPYKFAAVNLIDDDRMQIRFGDDITVLSSPAVFNSSDTLVLERVLAEQP